MRKARKGTMSMSRNWGRVCVAHLAQGLLTMGLLVACGGLIEEAGDDGQTGSETHWLSQCTVDDDCARGQCLCGVCSLECSGDADCTNGSGYCYANGSPVHHALCDDGLEAPEKICAPSCEAGCSEGQSCSDGVCLPNERRLTSTPVAPTNNGSDTIAPDEPVQWQIDSLRSGAELCLSGAVPVAAQGEVDRVVLRRDATVEDCLDHAGLLEADSGLVEQLHALLVLAEHCEPEDCAAVRVCEVQELNGAGAVENACQMEAEAEGDGWCYLQPGAGIGSEELAGSCEQRVRFLGEVAPSGSQLFFAWRLP